MPDTHRPSLATSGPVARVTIVSGNNQTAPVTEWLPLPIVVRVEDSAGAPVAGVVLTLEPTQSWDPEVTVLPSPAVTDADGMVAIRWRLGRAAIDQLLGITTPNDTRAVATAHARPGPLDRVEATADLQRYLSSAHARTWLYARALDRFANLITGLPIRFAVDSGGGQLLEQQGPDTTAGEPGNGVLWQLSALERRNVAHVEVGGASGSVSSPPVVVLGTVGLLTVAAGDSQHARPGQAVPNPVIVQASTLEGVPLGAGFVVFFGAVDRNGGFKTWDSTLTDVQGLATAPPWVLEPGGGWNTMLAQGELTEAFVWLSALAVPPKPERIVAVDATPLRGVSGNFPARRPEVIVLDSAGLPMPDQPIFAEAIGGAGIARAFTLHRTDSTGRARVAAWRLGLLPGTNYLRVSTPDLPPAPIVFEALVDPVPRREFSIDARFHGVFPLWIGPPLQAARAAWARVITDDIPDVTVNLPADPNGCHPALSTAIDDVLVFVVVADLDGPGRTTATSDVCVFRTNGLPLVSRIVLDHADLVTLDESAGMERALVHMLGHALGFGTAWVRRPDLVDGVLGRFHGSSATAAYNWARWAPGQQAAPSEWVHLNGSEQNGEWIHWPPWLTGDVMTAGPAATSGISAVTLGALRDLGYGVDDSETRDLSSQPPLSPPAPVAWRDRVIVRPPAPAP